MNWIIGFVLVALMGFGAASPSFINLAIEKGLEDRFGPFEGLRVAVDTDLLKALKGEVRGLDIQAQGFRVQEVPITSARLTTAAWHYDSWSAIQGKPRWNEEIEVKASANLSEAAINELIGKPKIQEKLKGIRINLPMAETADVEHLKVRLLDRRFSAQGSLELGTGFPIPFLVSGLPVVREGKVYATDVQLSVMGMPLSPALYEESLKRPFELPPSPDLKYRLEGLTFSAGSVQVAGTVWLPPSKK